MQLDEKAPTGEPLYECDMCQTVGMRDVCILDEMGKHYCMSCWYEKQRNRARKHRSVLVEI
jgi:hypothetical protein